MVMELFRCAPPSPQLLMALLATHHGSRCVLCMARPLSAPLFDEDNHPTVEDPTPAAPWEMLSMSGAPSPELMAARLHSFLLRRPFPERGALLYDLVEQGEHYRPLLTLLLLDQREDVLAPVLAHAGSRRDAAQSLARIASMVLEDLVELEGVDFDDWSPVAHWLGLEVSGFLSAEALATRVPLTLLLDRATPGVAPCRFRVVVEEIETLRAPEQMATFIGLMAEWRGSLRDLVIVARNV